MAEMNFSEMMAMQRELAASHEGEWDALAPAFARNRILWLMEELGESIAIIKKKGEAEIMNNQAVRENFCAELCDVLMYFNDTLLCYGITPEEISQAYRTKHRYNMKRNYEKQNEALYNRRVLNGKSQQDDVSAFKGKENR